MLLYHNIINTLFCFLNLREKKMNCYLFTIFILFFILFLFKKEIRYFALFVTQISNDLCASRACHLIVIVAPCLLSVICDLIPHHDFFDFLHFTLS